jgi:hypothetical protein
VTTPKRGAERALVGRCLAGDEEDWRTLFLQQRPRILATIGKCLGRMARDHNLMEEIAARVWLALVVKDRDRLRRFDPERGRLGDYLGSVTYQQVQLYFRRQRRRPEVLLPEELLFRVPAPPPVASLEAFRDFGATLAPQEQRFLAHLLGLPAEPGAPPLSAVNYRKLKQRVLAKFRAFMEAL